MYKARAVGEQHVVRGVEACKAHDETVRETWTGKERTRDVDTLKTLYADLFSLPFEAEKSEI